MLDTKKLSIVCKYFLSPSHFSLQGLERPQFRSGGRVQNILFAGDSFSHGECTHMKISMIYKYTALSKIASRQTVLQLGRLGAAKTLRQYITLNASPPKAKIAIAYARGRFCHTY